MNQQFETEQDLQALIGRPESIRLEFKESKLLDKFDLGLDDISREISAMANTEGGHIIIGMVEERKGVECGTARALDNGFDLARRSVRQLEDWLCGNISPPVHGLRMWAIPLSAAPLGRVALVVWVPRGHTVHQDRRSSRYYGRSEFSCYPLQDNQIRLLMTRGKIAHAVVEPVQLSSQRGARLDPSDREPFEFGLAKDLGMVSIFEGPDSGAVLNFYLQVRNDGPVTIRDGFLQLDLDPPSGNGSGPITANSCAPQSA